MKTIENNRVQILNSPVDRLTMEETILKIEDAIINKKQLQHVCVNAGKYIQMQHDTYLLKAVNESDIISADGQSIIWASKLLGDPLPERVSGINLMDNLIVLAHKKKYRCYFLGAREEIVSKVVEIYTRKYSPDIIAGYNNGYYSNNDEQTIVNQINQSKADMLFIAISSPKKEIFLNKYKNILTTPFIMGVGGSFDVVAGIVKRAPVWMQNNGLEWVYRLIQEPVRMWRRYILGNPHFIYLVLLQKLGLYSPPKQ